MDVQVSVTINAKAVEGELPPKSAVVSAVEDAVENALARDQNWGFVHKLESELSLSVTKVSATESASDGLTEALAREIAAIKLDVARDWAARAVADVLADFDPGFDYARFMAMCKVEVDEEYEP